MSLHNNDLAEIVLGGKGNLRRIPTTLYPSDRLKNEPYFE